VLSRDTFSFVAGWFLIIWQGTVADPFIPTVFAGGIVIALVPGALAAWAIRAAGPVPIEPPSSASAARPSSEPSSS
jgi:hypothetical protein